jgi:spermidine synthase
MIWIFLFFCVSGFCSILYEIVWLRLSMASFGVTSALVSIVLSVFMGGLGLGSWGSGRLIRAYGDRMKRSALSLYALAELLIGVSAIVVPYQLTAGRHILEHLGVSSSAAYYFASGVCVGITIIPWCACMGATIPLAMLAIRTRYAEQSQRSFSFLYAANVLGATVGTVLPLLLIELRGFRGTLKVGGSLNVLLAITAMILSRRWALFSNNRTSAESQVLEPSPVSSSPAVSAPSTESPRLLALLFIGGLTSMGAEVVWIRQFTPYMGTMVYAFASILGSYLISTFVGSWIYRRWSSKHAGGKTAVWALIGLAMLLPLVTADPSLNLWQEVAKLRYVVGALRAAVGIIPFCGLLGFVTPMLVDRWSGGDPDKAGRAYAVNVVGCILGPLLSGFVLLPFLNERWVLFLFALPWLIVGFNPGWLAAVQEETAPRARSVRASYAIVGLAIVLVLVSRSFESRFPERVVMRDSTATTMGVTVGDQKDLRVNGTGMTGLTPITKMMAHMPLASLDHPPQSALVICFGMGTTFRSLLSWNIQTTAVELVPGVPKLFYYFHPDAPQLLSSPLAHVEVDDGRRYLERTTQQYDVITIDPPPPVESAGSSLLYSKEFYSTIKERLQPGGILQQWLPSGDGEVQTAIMRALEESFPYVRIFPSVTGYGAHFLASERPLPRRSAEELVQRMPAAAVHDMMEWGPKPTPVRQFAAMLDHEIPAEQLLDASPQTNAMQDDRPVNEYFLLRLLKRGMRTTQ